MGFSAPHKTQYISVSHHRYTQVLKLTANDSGSVLCAGPSPVSHTRTSVNRSNVTYAGHTNI